jgi:hypothetical protein
MGNGALAGTRNLERMYPMPSISPRRTFLALAVTAALATAALVGLPTLAAAAGMMIDPNGVHRAAPAGFTHLSEDAGMMIDPNGAQRAATSGFTHLSEDAGMMIDPNGAR